MARSDRSSTSQPFRSARLASRHRAAPRSSLRGPARGRRASPASGRGLVLLVFLAAPVRAAEVAPDVPAAASSSETSGRSSPTSPLEDLPRPADLSLVWYDPSGGLHEGLPALADGGTLDLPRPGGGGLVEGRGNVRQRRDAGGAGDPPRQGPRGRRRSERVLGLVVPAQEPQRAVWVFHESLRLTLGLDPGLLEPREEADALGRALGRVVAHEVIHAIAPLGSACGRGSDEARPGRRFLLGTEGLRRRALRVGLRAGSPDGSRRAHGRQAAAGQRSSEVRPRTADPLGSRLGPRVCGSGQERSTGEAEPLTDKWAGMKRLDALDRPDRARPLMKEGSEERRERHGHCPPLAGRRQEAPSDHSRRGRARRRPAHHPRPLAPQAGRAQRRAGHGLDRHREARRDAAPGARPRHAGARGDPLDPRPDRGPRRAPRAAARRRGQAGLRDPGAVEPGARAPGLGRRPGSSAPPRPRTPS